MASTSTNVTISPVLHAVLDRERTEFMTILYSDDRNSYYPYAHVDADGNWHEHPGVTRDEVMIVPFTMLKDCYIARNGFVGKKRDSSRCRQINSIMFDIDAHNPKLTLDEIERAKADAWEAITKAVADGVIPMPSVVVDTGRGLQLYYVFKRSVSYKLPGGSINEKGLALVKYVQSSLGDVFENILDVVPNVKVDRSVADFTRVSRIPGTVNSKTGTLCRLLSPRGGTFDLAYLKTFCPKNNWQVRRSNTNLMLKRKVKDAFDALAYDRIQTIRYLQRRRNFDCEGNRELMCFCFYDEAVLLYDRPVARALTEEFNQAFRHPIDQSELDNIYVNVDKVGHYLMRASTFARKLGMTRGEKTEVHFKKSSQARRRELSKQQTKEKREERDKKIIELYQNRNMTQKEVAEAVGCSPRTVSTVLAKAGLTKPNKRSQRQIESSSPTPETNITFETSENAISDTQKIGIKRRNSILQFFVLHFSCEVCKGVPKQPGRALGGGSENFRTSGGPPLDSG